MRRRTVCQHSIITVAAVFRGKPGHDIPVLLQRLQWNASALVVQGERLHMPMLLLERGRDTFRWDSYISSAEPNTKPRLTSGMIRYCVGL